MGDLRRQRPIDISYYEWSIIRWMTSSTRAKLDGTGRGIMRELWDLCYAQGKIPADHKILAEFCAVSLEDFERSWKVIGRHFSKSKHDPDALENRFCTVWRTNYFRYIETQRGNGQRSGNRKSSNFNPLSNSGLPDGGNLPYEPNRTNESNQPNEHHGGGRRGGAAGWPISAAAMRKHFPATDDSLVVEVVVESQKRYKAAVNGHAAPPLTDEIIGQAIENAHWPAQESAAGFRKKVPRIIQTWAEQCIQNGTIR